MRVSGYKIGRNDPCWCDSGKKYKRCHWDRANIEPQSRGQIGAQLRKDTSIEMCLHPDSPGGCTGKIIDAHTIQRSRVLSEIIDVRNHVLTFHPKYYERELEPKLVGWQKASTFTGFCSGHDSNTFAPFEQVSFTGSSEQCFLISYRALCYEIYMKKVGEPALLQMKQTVDRGLSLQGQFRAQHALNSTIAGNRRGLRLLLAMKAKYDQWLATRNFEAVKHLIIEYDGPQGLATCGVTSPTETIGGVPLQSLTDPNATLQYMSVNIIRSDTKGIVIISFIENESASEAFVAELITNYSGQELASILTQYVFKHIENTFFSSSWWEQLAPDTRVVLRDLALIEHPYYTPTEYDPQLDVNWRVTSHRAV